MDSGFVRDEHGYLMYNPKLAKECIEKKVLVDKQKEEELIYCKNCIEEHTNSIMRIDKTIANICLKMDNLNGWKNLHDTFFNNQQDKINEQRDTIENLNIKMDSLLYRFLKLKEEIEDLKDWKNLTNDFFGELKIEKK